MTRPTEAQIQAAMERIGCDYMQAYYHCQGAERARQLAEAQRRERLAAALRAMRAGEVQ